MLGLSFNIVFIIFKLSDIYSLFNLSCKHKYELINQFEMPSEFDIIIQNGKIPNTHNSQKRRVVTDYKCKECGKIKRLQAVTPN